MVPDDRAPADLPPSPPLVPPVIGAEPSITRPEQRIRGDEGPPTSPPDLPPVLPPTPPGPGSPFGNQAVPFGNQAAPFGNQAAPLPLLPTRPIAATPPSSSQPRTLLLVAVAAALVASLLTAGLVLLIDHHDAAPASTATTGGNSQLANRGGLDIQSLLQKAQPSVVSIQTGETSSAGVYGAAGSGVIISDDGLVLTNAHVIESATTMQVTLSDGRSVQADLVGSLPSNDIALISLRDPGTVTPAELGTSADVRVGDDVVAIGNALNLGGPPSVTEGIVSAKDRSIEAGSETLHNLIQTDAAINPGNSGGPLLDAQGQVVGINTAIISDAQSIGFAIAIDSIKPLIDQIKAGQGAVTKDTAFLGVSSQSLSDMSPDVLSQYGVRTTDGAFVTDLSANSAAADAGLQLGDVITAIDGQPVTSSQDVLDAVLAHQPGDTITITYERGGQTASLDATLRSHG